MVNLGGADRAAGAAVGNALFSGAKFLGITFVAFMAIFAVIFMVRGGLNTGAGTALAGEGEVAAETATDKFFAQSGLLDIWEWVSSPEKKVAQSSFESELEENSKNADLGMQILKFDQDKTKTFSDEPFIVEGTLSGMSIESNKQFNVYCSLDKDSGDFEANKLYPAQLFGTSTLSRNSGEINPNFVEIFQAICEYPGIFATKPITSAKARMYTIYEFDSRASYPVYILDSTILKRIRYVEKTDPFTSFGIIEPTLNNQGVLSSTTTAGPIDLAIGIPTAQPLTSGTEYSIVVELGIGTSQYGNVQKLEKLELDMPSYLKLIQESTSLTKSSCDFEYTGPSSEMAGWDSYTLSTEKMERINQDCSEEAVLTSAMTREDCIDFYKSSAEFRCRLKVDLPQDLLPQTMERDFIRAYAKYVYEIDTPAAIQVYQRPEQIHTE
jgi:hypothetical protein